jgi:hypothetical protein
MAQPSRTTWPEYAQRPVICAGCGTRVTLKQAWRCWFDERTQEGAVWHRACDPHRMNIHNSMQGRPWTAERRQK